MFGAISILHVSTISSFTGNIQSGTIQLALAQGAWNPAAVVPGVNPQVYDFADSFAPGA